MKRNTGEQVRTSIIVAWKACDYIDMIYNT